VSRSRAACPFRDGFKSPSDDYRRLDTCEGSERLIARIGVVLGKTLLVTGPGAGDGSPCRTRRDQLTKLREVLAVRDIASFVMSRSNGGAFRRSYREWRLTPSHRCEGVGRSELIA